MFGLIVCLMFLIVIVMHQLSEFKENQAILESEIFKIKCNYNVDKLKEDTTDMNSEELVLAQYVAYGYVSSAELDISEDRTTVETAQLCNKLVSYSPYEESTCKEIVQKGSVTGYRFETKNRNMEQEE